MLLSSPISFVTVQFQLVVLHICWKELLDDQYSCTGSAGSQPVSSMGRAHIHQDLGVVESINPPKMKLCPSCHSPFSSRFAVYFLHVDDGRNS